MNNQQFLQLVASSFVRFLETSARSNEKLKVLHGKVAHDISDRLGEHYSIKSLGINDNKEGTLDGRYVDKKVDILISKDAEDIAGIGLKFVMNNYSQNSNNYFENMLGETANIRANNKKYFQILIIPEEMPYYDNKGNIQKWEKITNHNVDKYIILSRDNVDVYLHTPIKTLLFLIKLPECNKEEIKTRAQYTEYYLNRRADMPIQVSSSIAGEFGEAIILNDYEIFISKVVHYLMSI